SCRQIASRVENRIAFALPVLRIDRLARVMPTRSASSVNVMRRAWSSSSRFTTIAMLDRPCEFGAHVTAAPEDLRKHEDQEHGEQPGHRDVDRIVDFLAHGPGCEQVNHRLDQRTDHVDAEEEPGDADKLGGIRLDEWIADTGAVDHAPQSAENEM